MPALCFLLPLVGEFLSPYVFSASYKAPGQMLIAPPFVTEGGATACLWLLSLVGQTLSCICSCSLAFYQILLSLLPEAACTLSCPQRAGVRFRMQLAVVPSGQLGESVREVFFLVCGQAS